MVIALKFALQELTLSYLSLCNKLGWRSQLFPLPNSKGMVRCDHSLDLLLK
jgi:hypothetical protein